MLSLSGWESYCLCLLNQSEICMFVLKKGQMWVSFYGSFYLAYLKHIRMNGIFLAELWSLFYAQFETLDKKQWLISETSACSMVSKLVAVTISTLNLRRNKVHWFLVWLFRECKVVWNWLLLGSFSCQNQFKIVKKDFIKTQYICAQYMSTTNCHIIEMTAAAIKVLSISDSDICLIQLIILYRL